MASHFSHLIMSSHTYFVVIISILFTYSTYSHLYPNKHQEIVNIMKNWHQTDVEKSQKKGSQPKSKKFKVASPENITNPKQVHKQPLDTPHIKRSLEKSLEALNLQISAPRKCFAFPRSRAFDKCPQSHKNSHLQASLQWLFITRLHALISLLSRRLLDDCSNTS